MSRSVAFLFIALLLFVAGSVSAQWPPVWPKPAQYSNGTTTLEVWPTTSGIVSCGSGALDSCSFLLGRAFERTLKGNVLDQHVPEPCGAGAINQVTISVKDGSNLKPYLGMDESYELVVPINGSSPSISCSEIFGCYHGMETLSQLMYFDFDSQTFKISGAPWMITDAPRFQHRGLLIDSVRHWLPLRYIRRVIDSVTYAKVNVIHWHLTDAQSWPFDSRLYPQLAKAGAWSPQQRYTRNDVVGIIQYASDRGIRVMVEYDTPGHTGGMFFGLPELQPTPHCSTSNVDSLAIDISNPMSYTVAENLIEEFADLFPDKVIHLGGDEVDYSCWTQDPNLVAWLKEKNFTATQGYEYWVHKMQEKAWSLGKEVVGWTEIWLGFGLKLNQSVILQTWLPDAVPVTKNVTDHGYRVLWSDESVWYLDHLNTNWTQMYTADPCNGLPQANCDKIIGGEGCMWGETVDASDGLQTIWPRFAAIAERLWSPLATTQDLVSASQRLHSFRCLLDERGIPAAPVNNSVAREAPPGPGNCYNQ